MENHENKKIPDQEALQKELTDTGDQTVREPEQMGSKLQGLLKKEIEESRRREKTRGAEMIGIFAAHNYYANGFTPVELRTTLEDLGPTYVKIGQIMSSRVDLLPESYCKELETLRQHVKPLDAEIARAVIEEETGKTIDELYSVFRDKPLGSASIGQAHYAVLKDGTRVVTKVQRPLIADMMRKDFVLLKKLAKLVNVVVDSDDGQMIDLLSVIEELEKVTEEELDFRIEAENTRFFKENCIEDEEKISCPTVIDELTTERIFTMTFVDGYTVSHKERMLEDGCDVMEIGRAITENFVHQVFDVGTFHADPHQGNIMVSQGKPYWIDFGMVGHVTEKDIDIIQSMVMSLLSCEPEELVNSVTSMGATSSKTNRDKLLEDAQVFLDKYDGTTGISDINISDLFAEVTDLANKHHIQLPGQFTMLVRAVISIEGVIEQLCPDLDLFKLLSDKLIDRMKQSFDLRKTLLDSGKDILATGKKTAKIPSMAAEALSSLSKGRLKINMALTGVDEPLDRIERYVRYVVLALIACVLFIGSCILAGVDLYPKTSNGMPLIADAIMVFSIALGIYAVRKLASKK